jgi:hypothetical protein
MQTPFYLLSSHILNLLLWVKRNNVDQQQRFLIPPTPLPLTDLKEKEKKKKKKKKT